MIMKKMHVYEYWTKPFGINWNVEIIIYTCYTLPNTYTHYTSYYFNYLVLPILWFFGLTQYPNLPLNYATTNPLTTSNM